MAAPKPRKCPCRGWIQDTCSIAASDGGVPEGIGLRSDSLQEDWHEYYYGLCIRVIVWLIVDRFRYWYLCFVCMLEERRGEDR
jgi:hypothetical protein